MILDHVMLLNLEKREDRYFYALGALGVLGFPVYDDQFVIRFLTHDGLKYRDTKSVHEAAIADGFEEFSEFRCGYRAEAAWWWSYRAALRRIIEMDATVLLLIDDHVPKRGWTYNRMCLLVEECDWDEKHGFRIIQLLCPEVYAHLVNNDPDTAMLAKGLAGYSDHGVIINAEGAELMLSVVKEYPADSPEGTYMMLMKLSDNPEMFRGLWHTIESIIEGSHYNFRSNWSVNGPSIEEPWEA